MTDVPCQLRSGIPSNALSRSRQNASSKTRARNHATLRRSRYLGSLPICSEFGLARGVHRSGHTLSNQAMSKSAAPVETSAPSATSRRKGVRKARAPTAATPDLVALAASGRPPSASQAKPLLIGVGIGAALALAAVALASRPKASYFGPRPPTVAGAFTNAAVGLLARFVARKALKAAARHGARQLASAWPL